MEIYKCYVIRNDVTLLVSIITQSQSPFQLTYALVYIYTIKYFLYVDWKVISFPIINLCALRDYRLGKLIYLDVR